MCHRRLESAASLSLGVQRLMDGNGDVDVAVVSDRDNSAIAVLNRCGDATSPACVGDLDGDEDTDFLDGADLASNFGAGPNATRAQGDLNGDGLNDTLDVADLAKGFGRGLQIRPANGSA
jgi:hypothetical protein